MIPTTNYRGDIDGLRALAVLAVVVFHLGASWLPGGYAGVDVFFVISGYLITSIISREMDAGTFSFVRFYERRLRRLYPALILVLLVTAILAAMILMPREFRRFSNTLVAAPLFASNFMFLGTIGYFDTANLARPLLHTWSLGVEEQFYIVFPWLLIAARRSATARLRWIAIATGVSLAASIVAALVDFEQAFFLLPTRFWELGIGALLAVTHWRVADRWRSPASALGLCAIVFACVFYDETVAFPGFAALVPCLGTALVIASAGGLANRFLANPAAVYVGRISYPLYLWHWPLITFALYARGEPLDFVTSSLILAACVVLSDATMRLVERPVRERRVLAGVRPLFTWAGAASVALALYGVMGIVLNGWPQRLQDEALRYAAFAAQTPLVREICQSEQRSLAPDHPPCVIGDPAAERPSFAVLGDSHARNVAGEIGAVAREHGLQGVYLGRVGCPPMVGIDLAPVSEHRCNEHIGHAIETIRRQEIGTVFILARWGILPGKAAFRNEKLADLTLLEDGRRVTSVGRAEAIEGGVRRLVDALADRDVHVLKSIPEIGFDVPMVYAASAHFGRLPPPGPTLDAYRERQATVERIWNAVAQDRPRVHLLDPTTVFCPLSRCLPAFGDTLLYTDDDHLTRFGAMIVARMFEPAMLAMSSPGTDRQRANTTVHAPTEITR